MQRGEGGDERMSAAHNLRPRPTPIGYRTVLAAPRVVPLLTGTLIGRLPAAIAPLAILIAASSGGYARAGLLSGLQSLAAAVSQPLLARITDRRDQRGALAACTAVTSLAFAALALRGTRAPETAPLVLLTGAAAPPWQSSLCARWPQLLAQAAQPTALALDAVATEALYLIAPLLAAGLCLASPTAAFAAMAGLGALGAALVLTTAPSGLHPAPGRGERPGPLRCHALRALLPLHLTVGACLGAVPVAALAVAARCHTPALTGILPAALFTGSMIGGLVYGARATADGGGARHLLGLTIAFAAGWILLPALAGSAFGATAAALAAGLCVAPLLTCSRVLCARIGPAYARTEAAAWLIGCLGLGEAAGTAVTAATSRILSAVCWPLLAAVASLLALLLVYRRVRAAESPDLCNHAPAARPAAPDRPLTTLTARLEGF
jgi:hypothetical protein